MSNPLTENKTFVGLQSFKLLHGMALFSEILSGGSPSLTQEEVSNPLTENKTFVGLQSFKLLHGMALFSEILSGGSPSQGEVSMFSTEHDSSSSFILEVSLLLFFLPLSVN